MDSLVLMWVEPRNPHFFQAFPDELDMGGLRRQSQFEENILKAGVTLLLMCFLGVWVVTGLIYSLLLIFSLQGN